MTEVVLSERAKIAVENAEGPLREKLSAILRMFAQDDALPTADVQRMPGKPSIWVWRVNSSIRLVFKREAYRITVLDVLDRSEYVR